MATDSAQDHDLGAAHGGPTSLAAALEREHREIDDGLAAFAADDRLEQRLGALERAITALRRHIYLEEEFLFPPLRDAGLAVPVFVMLREHAQLWATLDELERELREGGTGLRLCHQLVVALQHHNLKEERVLYPQADIVLTQPAAGHLHAFIETGQLPAGWVCQRYGPRAPRTA